MIVEGGLLMSAIAKTEHPHIVCRDGVCGGEPLIDGLRVTVHHVATLYLQGESLAEIRDALDLTDAQVIHALSYFFDRRDEIMALIAQEEQSLAHFRRP
jgi:uncharacterized protein (DUF433 family)